MGIFTDAQRMYRVFRATIQLRDRILGGVPKNQKTIADWIRAKTGITDEEVIKSMARRTLSQLRDELGRVPTNEESIDALSDMPEAHAKHANTFLYDAEFGYYIESRQVKAMLREAVSSQYAGLGRWGKTKKGPKNFTAEHVFVEPRQIALGTHDLEGPLLQIINSERHGTSLCNVDYVTRPRIEFLVLFDTRAAPVFLEECEGERLARMWNAAENLGLGAARSQGYGTFDVVAWEEVTDDYYAGKLDTETGRDVSVASVAEAQDN